MSPSASEWPVYLIVHGHFYQPPRENPWIGRIERQDSAAPAHDWNERVTSECYRANCFSRRLDGYGRIDEVVNNFAWLSFNVGPTLFSYLERFHTDVSRRMVEADRASAQSMGGHGNAMAQVYNHVIMPLADQLDQDTQIRWGLADFAQRFGRPAAGMWLAETAVNDATADRLIANGVRWVILSPFQAEAYRPLHGEAADESAPDHPTTKRRRSARGTAPAASSEASVPSETSRAWMDAADGSIDTSRAYRVVRPGGTLDVLFYDAALSRAVSFEGLMRDANVLADRLAATVRDVAAPQLVHIATDGETFGHHHPFGDMCVAALMREAAPARGFTVTNPGLFLERVPPRWEVRLKEGVRGEGTAWSCGHGVGRWYRDCGCSTGGRQGWHQRWRTPLREGLDHLKDELRRVFVRHAGAWLTDPWAARDAWIDVVLADYAPAARDAFFEAHLARPADAAARADLAALLESQKYAMYMYTSCAWFFADVSGIEAVQNLKYAARAIELARPFSPLDFEEILLCHLRRAESNLPEWRDGGRVYKQLVKAYAGQDRQIAFNALVERSILADEPGRVEYLGYHTVEEHEREPLEASGRELRFDDGLRCFDRLELGRFVLANRVTGHRRRFAYLMLRGPSLELETWVALESDVASLDELRRGVLDLLSGGGIESVHRELDILFGVRPFSGRDVFYDLRQEMAAWSARAAAEELGRRASEEVERFGGLARSIMDMELPLPPDLRRAVDGAFEARLRSMLSRWPTAGALPLEEAGALVAEAATYGVTLERRPLSAFCSRILLRGIRDLRGPLERGDVRGVDALVAEVTDLLEKSKKHDVPLERQMPEEELDMLIDEFIAPRAARLGDRSRDVEMYRMCTAVVGLSERLNFGPRRRRTLLGGFERLLANDPELWP